MREREREVVVAGLAEGEEKFFVYPFSLVPRVKRKRGFREVNSLSRGLEE